MTEPALARVGLRIPDLAAAVRLFADLLGGAPMADGVGWLDLGFPEGGILRLVESADAPAGLDHLLVEVADLTDTARRITAAGLATTATGDGLEVVGPTAGARTLVAPRSGVGTDARFEGGAVGVRRFDHVCLATTTIRETVALHRDLLGGAMVFGGVNPLASTLSSQVGFGTGPKLELLQPHDPDAPIARFLARYGPGMHHLTFFVDDVAHAERVAREAGFETTGIDGGDQRRHWQETFLRPRTTFGLLVQLAWTDVWHDRALSDDEVAAVHDGRIDSFDYTMRPLTS
ncbi:MAG TPA: VOC family protein [Acidimicrobiia bacterium]|nr:VOC family protein [Acidimicrobiia bacterium]